MTLYFGIHEYYIFEKKEAISTIRGRDFALTEDLFKTKTRKTTILIWDYWSNFSDEG